MSQNYLSIYAKSFNWAGFFLPKSKYNNCSTLYDFCRTVDNIADEEENLDIKKKNFKEFKKRFYEKDFSSIKIRNMWQLIHEFSISTKIIDDLFDGIETDLQEKVLLSNEKDLLIYSYRVAGTVGLMMAKILLKLKIYLGRKKIKIEVFLSFLSKTKLYLLVFVFF